MALGLLCRYPPPLRRYPSAVADGALNAHRGHGEGVGFHTTQRLSPGGGVSAESAPRSLAYCRQIFTRKCMHLRHHMRKVHVVTYLHVLSTLLLCLSNYRHEGSDIVRLI